MTVYRLKCLPKLAPFASATEAVLFALQYGLPAKWEAVTA